MLPKISVVTPSYNQAHFIEEAIHSVLLQRYPNLENIIVDGGSTDRTITIIHKYSEQLAYFSSEPDEGMYHALNKGFQKSTGEILAWLNADDKYTPCALRLVTEVFSTFSEIQWLTTLHKLCWNHNGLAVSCNQVKAYSSRAFSEGRNLPYMERHGWYSIQQESTIWRRCLWEKAGGALTKIQTRRKAYHVPVLPVSSGYSICRHITIPHQGDFQSISNRFWTRVTLTYHSNALSAITPSYEG